MPRKTAKERRGAPAAAPGRSDAIPSDAPFLLRAWARVDWRSGEFHHFVPPPPLWAWYLDIASSLLQHYQTGRAPHPTKKLTLEEVDKASEEMGRQHQTRRDPTDPDVSNADFYRYGDELTRLVFFLSRVPKHVTTFMDTLSGCQRHIAPVVAAASAAGRPLVLSSFGGGPLADILGFLLYLAETTPTAPAHLALVVHVFDLPEWAPVMECATQHAPRHFPGLELHFHGCDVIHADPRRVVVPDTDVFIFSYFLVEMQAYPTRFGTFFRGMMERAKPGALFISLDPSCHPWKKITPKLVRTLIGRSGGKARILHEGDLRGYSELPVPVFKFVPWSTAIQLERKAAKLNPAYQARPLPRGKGRRTKQTVVFLRPARQSRGTITAWVRPPDWGQGLQLKKVRPLRRPKRDTPPPQPRRSDTKPPPAKRRKAA